MQMKFESSVEASKDMLSSGTVRYSSKQTQQLFWSIKEKGNFNFEVNNGQIQSFSSTTNNQKLLIKCVVEN